MLCADLLTNAADGDDRVSLTLDVDGCCLHLLAFPAARSASSLFSIAVAALTLSLCLLGAAAAVLSTTKSSSDDEEESSSLVSLDAIMVVE